MPPLIELYVSGDSLRSRAARNQLERLCAERGAEAIELIVVDVIEEPERAVAAGVVETPTLIRREPPPEVRLVGDVSDEAAVAAALGDDG